MKQNTQFSTLDIVKAFNIPRERLREWMNRGFVKPTVPSRGVGTRALFNRSDIYLIVLFQRLLGLGLKRTDASRFIHFFKDVPDVSAIEYLYFRYQKPLSDVTQNLEKHTTPLFFWTDPEPDAHFWGFNLETGCFSWHPRNRERTDYDPHKIFPHFDQNAEEWDCIILINLKKIRQFSDKKLQFYEGRASSGKS